MAKLFRNWHALLVLIIIVAGAISVKGDGIRPAPAVSNGVGQTNYRNGGFDASNSLYLFLRFHGMDVQYLDILSELVSTNGDRVSLGDLRRTALRFGLRCEICQGNPSELERIKTPIIVLLDSLKDNRSRFAVMLPGSGLELIEGEDACIVEPPADEFRRAWTGYYMVPTGARVLLVRIGITAILVSVVFTLCNYTKQRKSVGGA